MNYLVITCHPYRESFNASAGDTIIEEAAKKGNKVFTIDLIADKFNPVMTTDDLRVWSKGQTNDELVKEYQKRILDSDILVFPFPIWWGSMPAVLKGFCDKVLLPGFAYTYGANGELIGKFTNKKVIIITTMETSKDEFVNIYKDPIYGAFIMDTLENCGFQILKYLQIDKIKSGGKDYTTEKLSEIRELIY